MLYVRKLLQKLESEIVKPFPNPQSMPGEDEGSLSLEWRLGEYRFTIDVLKDGKIDWFYWDKKIDKTNSDESISIDSLSVDLINALSTAFEESNNPECQYI